MNATKSGERKSERRSHYAYSWRHRVFSIMAAFLSGGVALLTLALSFYAAFLPSVCVRSVYTRGILALVGRGATERRSRLRMMDAHSFYDPFPCIPISGTHARQSLI